jgi:transcription elongation factor Elf1
MKMLQHLRCNNLRSVTVDKAADIMLGINCYTCNASDIMLIQI